MGWLAGPQDRFSTRPIHRFDPRYWTINFPRPMMASVITQASDGLRVDAIFQRKSDLVGVIWWSEDTLNHPLGAYETNRDYRRVSLSFRWRSEGIIPLDEVNGPTLTIEGRDAAGTPRTWFVRLWNYAAGQPNDAQISLDFGALNGGFLLPEEADPVWAGDVDRMFISLVAPGYDPSDEGPLDIAHDGWLELSQMQTGGGEHVLLAGDDWVYPHGVRIANGYDDVFSQTPERLVENMLRLGFRDLITHYVGMSHYYAVAWDSTVERFVLQDRLDPLNFPTQAWHADFFARAREAGFSVIVSLSYELFFANAPYDWLQRTHDNTIGLTGWQPPSGLIAPGHPAGMDYLARVLEAFGTLAQNAGLVPRFQIGEPWWWTQLDSTRTPCFYDLTTMAAYEAETGRPVPSRHLSPFEQATAEQQLYLDWLGTRLGMSTLLLRDRIRAAFPEATVTLLFYTPQVLVAGAPMLDTVNLPDQWSAPAFDYLQLEDYTHVIDDNFAARSLGLTTVHDRLGYPRSSSHYFAGFVLNPEDAAEYWPLISKALALGTREGYGEVVIWAWPQVARDGFVPQTQRETAVIGFHDVDFPQDIGFGSSGGPAFSTEIVATASGYEARNQRWAQARAQFDVGTGLTSENDLARLIAFFRARRGRAYGFRFRDWSDYRTAAAGKDISPTDQLLGIGDGERRFFNLVRSYEPGPHIFDRPVTHVRPETLVVAIDGVAQATGWQLTADLRAVSFDMAPLSGSTISAGFEFDVPVRFDIDQLDVSWDNFGAGQASSITLVEIPVDEIPA